MTTVRGPFARTAAGATVRSAPPAVRQGVGWSADSEAYVRRHLVDRTNAYRRGNGLGPVQTEPRLNGVAESYARQMAAGDELSHRVDGRRAGERARAGGYGPRVWENLGCYWHSAGVTPTALSQTLFDGWLASPAHAANLRALEARDIGVGLARSAKCGKWYAVLLLGAK